MTRDADPMGRIGNEGDELAMHYVSYDDCLEFCRRLNERERKAGRLPDGYEYGLPTEAQWEYACRAGSTTALYNGDIKIKGESNAPALDVIAWYGGNSSVNYEGRGGYVRIGRRSSIQEDWLVCARSVERGRMTGASTI